MRTPRPGTPRGGPVAPGATPRPPARPGERPWIDRRDTHELLRRRAWHVAVNAVVLAPLETAADTEHTLALVGSLARQIVRDRHARTNDMVVLERGYRDLLAEKIGEFPWGRVQPALLLD